MAILQKIRKRSALLLIVIGLAMLAFVVQDLFTKGISGLSRNAGSINGKDVSFEDFRLKVANVEKNSQQQGQNITNIQAANQVWDQETSVALLTDQFEKAGINVAEKQIIDNLSKNPQIGQNPSFLNELGKFDLKKFKEFFNASPEMQANLVAFEKDADINAKYSIYNNLIRGGMYTTTAEGKFKYELEQSKVNFDYVAVLFSTVKDSDVKVTDDEILAYMKKHEKRFKSEGTREVEYVVVADKPSTQDMDEAKAKITALLSSSVVYNKETGVNDTVAGFKNTANTIEFVAQNSDKPLDTTFVTKQQLNPEHADKLYALAAGEIYGPYIDGKYYCLSKMLAKKPAAKAKASHILIAWEGATRANTKEKRTKEQAKVKAEGILAQAKANPQMFPMLAFTNSEDPSVQQNGGDLGFFEKNAMVKPFSDFAFSNPVGSIGLVETEFGYHIVNVTDKQDAIKIATVAQKIEPSEATTNQVYTTATQFELDAVNGKDFTSLAKKANLTIAQAIKAKPMDEAFGEAGNQRQIVKWAYEDKTKIGDVKRFEVTNVGHVIARLKKINEKGLMTVEEVKPMLEGIIKNDKKAAIISAKMKGSSLDAIAKANATTVQNAPAASIDNAMLANVGMEQKVVGTAIGMAANKISAPIQGNSGIYVVKTKSVAKAPKIANYDEYVKKVKQMAMQVPGRIIPALKIDADIEDNRALFY